MPQLFKTEKCYKITLVKKAIIFHQMQKNVVKTHKISYKQTS